MYVMRGAFARRHLLAEARRHLSYALRGRPHRAGLDEEIVQAAIDGYTRRASRRMLTSDLRALYPRDTEDQAVLRALARKRAASLYERARLAAGGLTARVRAARRADRLNSRPRRHTVAVPGTLSSRTGRRAGRDLEATTDAAAVELTSRTLESAAAEMAARLQSGVRERAEAYAPPTEWQPIWKRPRKPKSIKAKKAELAKQRKRLKAAGVRRFYGAQSPRPRPRPRPRQNRIGSAAARRDTRALSRMRHSNALLWRRGRAPSTEWTAPESALSGSHRVGSTEPPPT
ncbi:hypothetical protein [Streptomyces goshikiensis]|uniref:hypothetical protein n=1 Tax=Streptomyces goshikiensis TaxID=1942 RepID=UPI003D9EFD14